MHRERVHSQLQLSPLIWVQCRAHLIYIRIYLILEWCCAAPLAVVPGRAAPLGVEIDAVVVRVPSHVVPVRKGYHRPWRRHLHARSLVFDTEYGGTELKDRI